MKLDLQKAIGKVRGEADWVSLRRVKENTTVMSFRDARLDTNSTNHDEGLMAEVCIDGHFGYAGTSDLSESGVIHAVKKAAELARLGARNKVFQFSHASERPVARGQYRSQAHKKLDRETIREIQTLLKSSCQTLKASDKIVTTQATTFIVDTEFEQVSTSGADLQQSFYIVSTDFGATAQDGAEVQKRSDNGGLARCRQVGLEVLNPEQIRERCTRIGREALELLKADECPSETLDLVLMPDQMLLQIHESIGHPLELDRILGDERNYAGWSFVKPENFGSLQYGSKLMNVTFDPSIEGELASYAFDDAGNPATREYLIKDGVLLRGLGSLESQKRLGTPGVANFRSSSWNRAPIDRMANINLEPGQETHASIIGSVERGVLMHSNRSWSIDDYRNKFQFGCEFAQLIEDGRITKTLKNPNYRGITVPFWNGLAKIGNADTVEMYGSPYCGKGEPNQVIRVGHTSPLCLFKGIEVFGGIS